MTTTKPGVTSAKITDAMRTLAPAPIRLRTTTTQEGWQITIAAATAGHIGVQRDPGWLTRYLTQRLAAEVHVARVEFTAPSVRGRSARIMIHPGPECGPGV